MKTVLACCSVVLCSAAFLGLLLPHRPAATASPAWLAVHGQPGFLVGVNYPWRSPQDFGNGPWGHAGVSHPTTYAEIETDFANLAAQGVHIVKWRVFNDGRYSPEFDQRGFVTGLDEHFFKDLDAAVELARRHDLYLVFSLLSSGFWTTDCRSPEGVQFGGHRDVLLNPFKRQSLITNAIMPMLQHLGRNDRVLAYEIIAEPEWGVQELHHERDWRIKVPLGSVRVLVAEVARAIHAGSPALATVEANRASHLPYWRGLGLDFYSFSWYDWLQPYDPLETPASYLAMDRPVVLGEFPASGSAYYELGQVLETVLAGGYAGAFAWSYWAGDQLGDWDTAVESYLAWARAHWQAIGPGGAGLPPETPPAPHPPPFSYEHLSLAMSQGELAVQLNLAVRERGQYQAKVYLRQLGKSEQTERLVSVEGGTTQSITARFSGLHDGAPYQVSLGIFDRDWRLLKWYESIARFVVQDSQVLEPTPSERQRENPCATAA